MKILIVGSMLLLASCSNPRAATCEDPHTGEPLALGAVRENAVCTDLVPGGWAVAAPPATEDSEN